MWKRGWITMGAGLGVVEIVVEVVVVTVVVVVVVAWEDAILGWIFVALA